MSDLNQGIKYTIEADSSKAEKALKSVGDASDKAGAKAIAGFSPMKALTSTLHGDFAGLGAEVAKLVPSFRKMADGGAAALGAVGAAVYSVFKLVGSLKDLIRTAFKLNGSDRQIAAISRSFSKMTSSAEEFADRMKTARSDAAEMSKRFDETAEAINRMTKAQNEFARAQALALANTDEEKAAINSYYDRSNADADAKKSKDLSENRRKSLVDEGARLQQELEESRKRQEEYERNAKAASARLREQTTGTFASLWNSTKSFFTVKDDSNEIARKSFNAAVENSNAADAEAEKQAELEKKIEANRHALKMANMEIETEEIEEVARSQKELNEDVAVEEKAIEREREQAAEEMRRQEEELEQIRIDAEKRIHDIKKRNLNDEQIAYSAAQSKQAEAEQRLAAAKSAVQRAWGWYRDKDSMKAQMEEEKANAEAERQYEKDFEKLRFRRDWRTAKNLSVDEEATRRVALAKEEEAAAQKAVTETAENTARAADAVEAIRAAIEGGVNVD